MQRIWSQCLGISGIDRNANFFEVGGDSLVAIMTAEGDLVNGSCGTYLHAVIPPIIIKYILHTFSANPGIKDGDLWFANDAVYGGVHAGRVAAERATREWAAAQGVRVLDVGTLVASHVLGGHGNPDGIHWGWAAHRRVGETLAELLLGDRPEGP